MGGGGIGLGGGGGGGGLAFLNEVVERHIEVARHFFSLVSCFFASLALSPARQRRKKRRRRRRKG